MSMNIQERVIRNVIKDEVCTAYPSTSKQDVRDISSFLMTLQVAGRTKMTAAIIRHLDSYYGVSEKTLALGTRIYEEIWGVGDDD